MFNVFWKCKSESQIMLHLPSFSAEDKNECDEPVSTSKYSLGDLFLMNSVIR